MIRTAAENDLVLMADHTYCYTPAVSKIRELVEEGALGEILFVDSVRINLGLIQPDVDVFWDLAPHDLSVFDFMLPGGLKPVGVSAQGADPINAGKACVGYLTLPLDNGAIAHVHVNWMSPTKIRQMVIGGSRRTLVWDDLNLVQRVSLYDRGVELIEKPESGEERAARTIAYRVGDTWAPALEEKEALRSMVEEFASSIRQRRAPRTDGAAGLRILGILEAAATSMLRQVRWCRSPVAPITYRCWHERRPGRRERPRLRGAVGADAAAGSTASWCSTTTQPPGARRSGARPSWAPWTGSPTTPVTAWWCAQVVARHADPSCPGCDRHGVTDDRFAR